MRTRTAVALGVVVVALGAAGAYGLFVASGSGGNLERLWTSDTATDILGNHHAPAVAEVDGETRVFAPISGSGNSTECALVALAGADGTERWHYDVPPANCTIHAVADPAVTDVTGDGRVEVLAATTERRVVALDPASGNVRRTHDLTSYGYTKPIAADLTGDGSREIVVVDVKGVAFAFGDDGPVWEHDLGGMVWGQPSVADFDADGEREVVVGVGTRDGAVVALDADGREAWRTDDVGTVTWLTTGQADGDDAVEAVAATSDGRVVALDGTDGSVEWRRGFGAFAAVEAFGDGDGDGDPEVYAVSRNGTLYALSAASGTTEWATRLTTEKTQMTPPPVLGDLDGDGNPEVVAPTNDGKVSVVDPDSGAVLATHERDVPIYTHAVLADLDGEAGAEVVVTYGDGRVVTLAFAAGE